MTWDEATGALLEHLVDRWSTQHPTIPIDVPNGRRITPDSHEEPWVRVRFRSSFSERDTLGGQHRSQGGRLIVNVFTPKEEGDGEAQSLGRDLESIVETAHANGLSGALHLGAPEPIGGHEDPEIGMWISGRSIPFRFDHTP